MLRELFPPSNGDWERLPYVRGSVVAAAKALDEQARLAFVEKVGAAFKTLVMSDTFAKALADSIKQEHQAVDHGITGLVSMEELVKRKDFAAIEARNKGRSAAAIVDNMESRTQDAAGLDQPEPGSWTRNADDVKRKDRAKYQKMVRDAQALQALGTSDVQKLRRGMAVLYWMDQGGPETEEALYALRDRAKAESEQLAWDQYNLKTVLRKQLTAFVALVPTVDFVAATKETRGHGALRQPGPRKERPGLEGLLPGGEAGQHARDGDGPGLAQGALESVSCATKDFAARSPCVSSSPPASPPPARKRQRRRLQGLPRSAGGTSPSRARRGPIPRGSK